MNRRDLLKAIGIGGILPFVGRNEVDATPPEVQTPKAEIEHLPSIVEVGSITIYGQVTVPYCGTEVIWTAPHEQRVFGVDRNGYFVTIDDGGSA